MIGMRRQYVTRAGAGQHADREPGPCRARHLEIVQAVSDDRDRAGRQLDCPREGLDHSRTRLGAVSAVEAAGIIDELPDAELLDLLMQRQLAVIGGDTEEQAASAQSA